MIRSALLYILAAVLLAVIVSMAWWNRLALEPLAHQVQPGQTIEGLSVEYGVPLGRLVEENQDVLGPGGQLESGAVVSVPRTPPTGLAVWTVHGAGLLAEIVGVLITFWLALVAGILPRGYRQQILGISVALGVASYAASSAAMMEDPMLTPSFIFDALKDGITWSAAFPLLANAFGFTRGVKQPDGAADDTLPPVAGDWTELGSGGSGGSQASDKHDDAGGSDEGSEPSY